MKFEKLRLTGFKSFVDPTEFVIEGGLTGVVGPNGCGKSNLVEALRWVMGENSYKNMRASTMDDVIFSGNTARPQRNSAEVGLILDNRERRAPAGFNDTDLLEITRRIERDSGSVYRINGRECRARDVQMLFADASTGARSPAMVRQGQISEIIAAKPTQRRNILEEAAGITGLHSRRHEAELRLKAAEQNLLRLEDVITTLETQLVSLRKQAKQATRFRNLSGEIRKVEATLHYLRFVEAADTLHDAEELLTQANDLIAERAQVQGAAAKDQAIAAHEIPALRDAESQAAAALQTLIVARDQLDSEEEHTRKRLTELETRVAQFADDLAREEQQIVDAREHLQRLELEQTELRTGEDGAGERIATAKSELEAATARLHASERALADLTRENADLAAERRTLQKTIENDSNDLDRTKRKLSSIQNDQTEVEANLADLDHGEDRAGLLTEAQEAVIEAEEAQAAAEERTEAARENEAMAREPVSGAQSALQSIDTEINTLERILQASAGATPSAPIVDALTVPSGLEKSLGAALGDDLEAPISQDAAIRWHGAPIDPTDPSLPKGATPFSDLITGPDELSRRLAQIGLVEEADGRNLQALLKPGQRLVAKSGALWRWDGLAKAADAPSAAAQRLATKNRLTELQASRGTAEAVLFAARQAHLSAQQAIEEARSLENETRQEVRAALQKISQIRDQIAEKERKAAKFQTQLASLKDHMGALERTHDRLTNQLTERRNALAALPSVEGLETKLLELRTTVAEERSQVTERRSGLDGLQRERDGRARRLAALLDEIGRVRRRSEAAEQHLATLLGRRNEATSELAALRDQPDDVAARRRAVVAKIESAETARQQASDARAAGEIKLAETDRLAKEANTALATAREAQIRAEERLSGAKTRLQEVQTRIAEELECNPLQAAQIAGLAPDDELPDPTQVETRLDRLKSERERLGGVNLRADQEMEEVNENLSTLVTERDDLVEAIRKLRQAVSSLNREARERLLAAFDVVNGHFTDLFTSLFGGGTAELKLVEAEDPLDAGLEIFARPPGKKPQTMTLLSGGEQALTTLALIFAVFLTNPAPICVLDEVDAPLDDANVERFCDLLDSMSKRSETRFLTITHNPITMARMSRLFGVTMVERGVSQLVSVDLEQAERFVEAEPRIA